MSPDRVVERYILARQGKPRQKEIPVRNRDTGRIVYVVPETLKEETTRFETVTQDDLKPPASRHKPTQARKPRKPDRPHRPEAPIPVPKPYLKPPQPPKPAKTPKPVKPLKPIEPMKVPEPVKHPLIPGRKQYRKIAERVVDRFLSMPASECGQQA
jgi:hypothetical protein